MLKKLLVILCLSLVSWSCSVRYAFNGASIAPDVKTASVIYFNNMAPMVAPILSPTLTDALTQKIQRETRLSIVREDGDVNFEGEIIGYASAPIAISGNEHATQNRLTITVKVRFTNKKQPVQSFDRTFSSYADYDTRQMLISIEGQLIPQIVEKLVENIFNDALAQW